MPRGGKRAGAGRPKGAVNKATADIRDIAQQYTLEAVEALLGVMRDGDSAAARVAAAREILDRGHGKPKQSVDTTVDGNLDLSHSAQPAALQELAQWASEALREGGEAPH